MNATGAKPIRRKRGGHLHIGPPPRRVRRSRRAWTLPLTWWIATTAATGFAIRHHPHLWPIPAVFLAFSIGTHLWMAWQKSMLTHGMLTMAKVDRLKRNYSGSGKSTTVCFHFKLPDGQIVKGWTAMPTWDAERYYRNRVAVLYRPENPKRYAAMVKLRMYEVVRDE